MYCNLLFFLAVVVPLQGKGVPTLSITILYYYLICIIYLKSICTPISLVEHGNISE